LAIDHEVRAHEIHHRSEEPKKEIPRPRWHVRFVVHGFVDSENDSRFRGTPVKNPKLKRRRRSVKPAAKRKKKVVCSARREKPKAFAICPEDGKSPAQPLPELEPIATRPLFDAPRHSYFLGGGVAMPAGFLPEGFVLACKRKPAGYRAAEFRSYRTFPEGEFLRCVRYELKPESVGHDLKAEDMPHIPAGNFFYQNGNDGPMLSVRCPCNQNLWRVGKSGSVRCKKCSMLHTAPTDLTGLPVMNSKAMNDSFSYDAAKLPRDRR
jgi:hypothetical protein